MNYIKDKAEERECSGNHHASSVLLQQALRKQVILASSLHKEDSQCVTIKATFFPFLGGQCGGSLTVSLYLLSRAVLLL